MNPFVTAQVHSVIEDIRLMEALVTELGLHSDIRMLRQGLPVKEAEDIPQVEARKRRIEYRRLTDTPAALALRTLGHIEATLSLVEAVQDHGVDVVMGREWVDRARPVFARAENKVAGDIRAETASRVQGLYVIVDPEATRGRSVVEIARAALSGGAAVVQLRDKSHDKGEVLPIAHKLRSMCKDAGALFIMNDDPGVALASDADGLHLGQTDMPLADARRILGRGRIVGLSNNSMDEMSRSQSQGADYLAVGAVYPTATMGKGDRPVVGPEMVRQAKDVVSQPVVAIGGITLDKVAEVVAAGADCVCVASAVTHAEDPEGAARALMEAIDESRR